MDAVHVAHDVAMIGMTLPGVHHGGHHGHHGFNPMDSICGSSAPSEPGMFDAFTDSSKAHQGLTLLSAAAAQFTGNAAISIPLYLGMGAATAVKIALSHSK